MRIKFTEDSGNLAIVDSFWFGLYDDEIIGIETVDDLTTLKSTKPLSSLDKLEFEKWVNDLMINGYLDLSLTDYRFEYDDDGEEDDLESGSIIES